jgi:transcriptional regulator
MFIRSCWQPRSLDAAYKLVDDYPWALLVDNGDDGPFATNLPLLLDRSRGAHGVLLGHLARANDHARALFARSAPSLAIFHGPQSYVTASWYPERQMPSTFYYMAVHCYGRLREQTAAELERTLGVLNDRMETPIPGGWRMDEIPHSEITRRLPHIVGFELEIERFEAKFKLGQDEPLRDALAVADRLAASADSEHLALAAAIRRENAGRAASGGA